METEMAGLTLEQQREIPGLIAGAAQRIHGFLAATPQEKEIIRPGEFCLDPGFYKDLNLETTTIIYKTLKHEVEHGDPHMFRAEFFSRAGEEALIRFINLGDTYALKRAVAYGSLAVYHVVERMPERGIVISAFARTLRQRWGLSNERGHLDEAIYFFRKTIDLEPEEETNRPAHFDDLAGALLSRYKELHHLEDFDEARRSFELAVSFQHPARPNFQSGLGQLLSERAKFEHPQDLQAFDEGITTLKVALEYLTDQFKGSIGMIYYHLGEAYMARYFASHAAEDWQRATEAFDETITRIKPISQNYLSSRCIVAGVYSDMFARFQTLEFSAKAESLYRLALTSYPDNVVVMASLAEQLRARATITMSQVSLNESVELIERAVQKTGDSESALPPRLEVQAKAFSDRFVLLGNLSDIDGAISALWRSLEALGLSDRDRWKHWKLLAHCLLVRYENTQEINDLQNAESAILSAVELDHHTSKSKSECLRISGKISFAKYNLDRNPTDLEKSINIYQQCIDLADREDQDVWICLNDLGNALLEKFETSKSNQDLQAAATSYQTALEKLRSSRTSSAVDNEAILLTGLGNVQFRQFKEWDRTADLDTAISYYQKSVDATSEFNARIASRAATLSFALQSRFDITHRIEDLEDAKRRLDAVAELPLHLPSTSRSYIENRIGTVYLRFFFHTHDSKYLDSAAVHFRKALSSGCSERAFNMSAASNLAKTLGHKCNMTKNDTDITAAITQFASLLRLAKQTDPEMGTIAMNTAEFFSSIYNIKKSTDMGKMALATYLMASQFGGISPKRKIHAKMKAAQLSFAVSNDAPMALNALKSAVSDLPEAILAGLNRGDQLRMIRETVWLPSNVAAAAIATGSSPEEAFRLFESSRGVIWESLLNEKYDIGLLESDHPELAGRFKSLQKRVTQMTSADKLENPQLDVLKGRQESHQAALQYNEVLAQIRSLAGFESFLRVPQEPSSLTEFAADGPVILVNCTEFRSDCLIIKQEGVVSIPLPGMTYDASIKNAANLMAALSEMGNSPEWASKTFEEVLIWLWNNVAEPIMQELGYLTISKSETQNRRVWWVSTGLISILPIHAAGDHRRALKTGEPCSVIDLTTSSYCNSLRSLDYARKTFVTSQLGQGKHNALLLQMPETPNCDSLPGVAKEVSLIKGILEKAQHSATVLDTPSREPVLSLLKTSQIAHFACHGVIDAEDPSLSRLLLKDWKQRTLNVRTLLRTKSLACQLIFLSACESAVGKDMKLREEGIHISGGFQMAGVPHVVGTLWRVDDQFGVIVAEGFYRDLAGDNGMNIERSSESLRRAVLDTRANGVDPLYWAAYIHSGP